MFVSVLRDGKFSNADGCGIYNVYNETDDNLIEDITEIDFPDVYFKMASDGYLEIVVEKTAKVRIL